LLNGGQGGRRERERERETETEREREREKERASYTLGKIYPSKAYPH
jgi:hypothetical protein